MKNLTTRMHRLIARLKLHNLWVVLFLLFLLVAALTYTNNHYFYVYKDILETRRFNNLVDVVESFHTLCREQASEAHCRHELITALESAQVPGKSTLFDAEGNRLWSMDNEHYQEERSSITVSKQLGESTDAMTLHVSVRSSPPIWRSVIRSMTFSAADIADHMMTGRQSQLWGFIEFVAIPRSRPAFFFLMAGLLTVFIFWLRQQALAEELEQRDEKIRKLSNQLDQNEYLYEQQRDNQQRLENEIKANEQENEEIKRTLESIKKSKKEVSSREKEIVRLQNKLSSNQEHLKITRNQLNQTNKELSQIEAEKERMSSNLERLKEEINKHESLDSASKKRLLQVLLTNPEIKCTYTEPSVKDSGHHGKEFIKKIGLSLKNYPAANLINSVISIEYSNKKRKSAYLHLDSQKNAYVLNVYSSNDAGYAAQFILKAKQSWEAVMVAKLLINTNSCLRGYQLNVRITEDAVPQ